jgi:hypothetical protein
MKGGDLDGVSARKHPQETLRAEFYPARRTFARQFHTKTPPSAQHHLPHVESRTYVSVGSLKIGRFPSQPTKTSDQQIHIASKSNPSFIFALGRFFDQADTG